MSTANWLASAQLAVVPYGISAPGSFAKAAKIWAAWLLTGLMKPFAICGALVDWPAVTVHYQVVILLGVTKRNALVSLHLVQLFLGSLVVAGSCLQGRLSS